MTTKKSTKKSAKKAAVARSAKNGKFVSEKFASSNPDVTVKEKRKARKKSVNEIRNGSDKPVITETNAGKTAASAVAKDVQAEPFPEFHPVFHAVHAEAVQAAEEGNKEVVTEIEPKPSVLEVARQAWAQVKDAADPEFDACVPTHRERFLFLAEGILKGGQPLEGETLAARFEQKVSELMKKSA